MIRLKRVGRKNDPSYRVIVIDKRKAAQAGKYVEMVGSYNPRQKNLQLEGERIKYWLSVGAKTSGTVHNLLVKESIIQAPKINVSPKQKPKTEEQAEEVTGEVKKAPTPAKGEVGVPTPPEADVGKKTPPEAPKPKENEA